MKKILSFALVVFLLTPAVLFAQRSGADADDSSRSGADADSSGRSTVEFGGTSQLENPLKNITTIEGFFVAIIEILLVFAIPFVVFFIIWAGFLYVRAQGNPGEIQRAHNALLYAVIGGVLILGANLLLELVTNTVNEFTN